MSVLNRLIGVCMIVLTKERTPQKADAELTEMSGVGLACLLSVLLMQKADSCDVV